MEFIIFKCRLGKVMFISFHYLLVMQWSESVINVNKCG